MIPVEGRVLLGLDEFMLRLGHLKVLCGVAAQAGGSRSRVRRETVRTLTKPCVVPDGARIVWPGPMVILSEPRTTSRVPSRRTIASSVLVWICLGNRALGAMLTSPIFSECVPCSASAI